MDKCHDEHDRWCLALHCIPLYSFEIGRGVHTGTATNRYNVYLQLPSFSYLLMFLRRLNSGLETQLQGQKYSNHTVTLSSYQWCLSKSHLNSHQTISIKLESRQSREPIFTELFCPSEFQRLLHLVPFPYRLFCVALGTLQGS